MFSGDNYIGFTPVAPAGEKLKVFSTVNLETLPDEFSVATAKEVSAAAELAAKAFDVYRKKSPAERATFLDAIAEEIGNIGDLLIKQAMQESGLTEARLTGERGRTMNQLKLFAGLLREGSWVEAVIDPALPDRKPLPRADLRKMLMPVGPVLVFGASNFPFAFSTAGGDTASALAAGCPVIVKAHSSHLGTNELMAGAIRNAAQRTGMPDGVFSFLIGEGSTLGQALAKHPAVKAIGFTGSFRAGMALYKTATHDREQPIPVFAEMSSINPVLIFPDTIEKNADKLATQLAGSITLGVGQFCTNPGLLFLVENKNSPGFIDKLATALKAIPDAAMLNQGICKSYYAGRNTIGGEKGVKTILLGDDASGTFKGSVALFQVGASDFIKNPSLQNEMFGPASMIVSCKDLAEMESAVAALHGQLTGTAFGTADDLRAYQDIIGTMTGKVGRLIYNSVPTGVEVCHAMVHGGPFPATTDARATSVGSEAIKRFVRPVCFQDCPDEFLPDALKESNPLGIMRKVDGIYITV